MQEEKLEIIKEKAEMEYKITNLEYHKNFILS